MTTVKKPRRGPARGQLRRARASRASIYGGLSLSQLEAQISDWAHELGLEPIFFQTNSEGEFCEYLHRSVGAGRRGDRQRRRLDALQLRDRRRARADPVPAVEVHLSDVEARDDWRKLSVFDGLVLAKVSGKGPDGYREALERLAGELGAGLMRGRGERLEGLLAEQRARPLARHRPDQRPLADRLHRHQRRLRLRPGVRLFLTDFRYTERAAAEVEGWETETRRRRLADRDRRAARGQGRLRRRPDVGPPARN